VKTDTLGNKEWDKTYGGSDIDKPQCTLEESDGYLFVGSSWSFDSGDKTTPNFGNTDYWIVRSDLNGNKQWDMDFGGSNYDEPCVVRKTADGGFIIGGTTQSNAGNDVTKGTHGGGDYWIIKLTAEPREDSLISNIIPLHPYVNNFSFKVSPNPFSASTMIEFLLTHALQVSIKLFSVDGKEMLTIADGSFTGGDHKLTFNREGLNAGIYFLQFKTAAETITMKVVVE